MSTNKQASELLDASSQANGPTLSIDVHTHLIPTLAYNRMPEGLTMQRLSEDKEFGMVADGIRSLGRSAPPALRNIERHRERQMQRGIDVSVIGPWMDAVKMPLDPQLQRKWCRVLNDSFAETLEGLSHSRFIAALPDLDGGAAAEELERAAAAGAVGAMLSANPELGTLARRDFDPLWRTAERLGLPIVLHPATVELDSRMRQHHANILVGNPFETTLSALSLIAARVPDRFPDLKILLVHGGGFFPYQYGRITAGFERWPDLDSSGMATPREYVRWFYYDTVLFEQPPLQYLLEVAGVDHVLAGSDCPFPMTDYQPYAKPGQRLGLSDAESAKLTAGNAATVFKLEPGSLPAPADLLKTRA